MGMECGSYLLMLLVLYMLYLLYFYLNSSITGATARRSQQNQKKIGPYHSNLRAFYWVPSRKSERILSIELVLLPGVLEVHIV